MPPSPPISSSAQHKKASPNNIPSKFDSWKFGASEIPQRRLAFIVPESNTPPHTPETTPTQRTRGTSRHLYRQAPSIIFPISPLMTGDASHFISYSFVNPDCKFLLLYPNHDPDQTANLNRIKEELSFFIPADRFETEYVDNPHQHFQSLISQKSYYRPGFATKNIADYANLVQRSFAEKLDPLLSQHSESINHFLHDTFLISPDSSVLKVFVWGRNSGDLKGAHPESDTSADFFNLTRRYILDYSQEKNRACQLIFIGDPPKSNASNSLSLSNVVNMFEFWKMPEFQGLIQQTSLPSNVLQLLLFYSLSEEGHSSRHISQRSGILDRLSFALTPDKNKFIVLIPEGFDAVRIRQLNKFYSIGEINSPLAPKGRFVQNLTKRVNDLEDRYPVDMSRVRGKLNSTFNLKAIENELKKLSHNNPELKISQDNYFRTTFKPMLEELDDPNSNTNLGRPLTTESIERIEEILKAAIEQNSPPRRARR